MLYFTSALLLSSLFPAVPGSIQLLTSLHFQAQGHALVTLSSQPLLYLGTASPPHHPAFQITNINCSAELVPWRSTLDFREILSSEFTLTQSYLLSLNKISTSQQYLLAHLLLPSDSSSSPTNNPSFDRAICSERLSRNSTEQPYSEPTPTVLSISHEQIGAFDPNYHQTSILTCS